MVAGCWCVGDLMYTLLGGARTDTNSEVIEKFLEGKNLVFLSDGRGTRIDVDTGSSV